MTLPDRYVGCDVSKRWLDIFDPHEGRPRRIPNTRADAATFAATLAGGGAFAVFEATGVYDRDLAGALHAAGVAHARINPTRARRYAQARGRFAKTDALDAPVPAAPTPRRAEPAPRSARRHA